MPRHSLCSCPRNSSPRPPVQLTALTECTTLYPLQIYARALIVLNPSSYPSHLRAKFPQGSGNCQRDDQWTMTHPGRVNVVQLIFYIRVAPRRGRGVRWYQGAQVLSAIMFVRCLRVKVFFCGESFKGLVDTYRSTSIFQPQSDQ